MPLRYGAGVRRAVAAVVIAVGLAILMDQPRLRSRASCETHRDLDFQVRR
jgi:hypothetical protein